MRREVPLFEHNVAQQSKDTSLLEQLWNNGSRISIVQEWPKKQQNSSGGISASMTEG
jgi:hypothetical protein